MSPQKILFIDAYDSFSNNIISLLRTQLFTTVESIHIDDPRFVFNDDAFFDYLQHFDAVVAGPGPGHPSLAGDVGLIAKLWNLPDDVLLPVLGVCLGFQSLCLAHGASVGRLGEPRHGLVTPITHCGRDVFENTGEVSATQYHSLHVKLEEGAAYDRSGHRLWSVPKGCRELVPLAWDLSDSENGPILMSAKHCHKPFLGVQYHPESICTNGEGHKLISNWWREACIWNAGHRATRLSKLAPVAGIRPSPDMPCLNGKSSKHVAWTFVKIGSKVDATEIVPALHLETAFQPLLLESGTREGKPVNAETGRFSIIGLHDSTSTHFRYSTSTHVLERSCGLRGSTKEKVDHQGAFAALEIFVANNRATNGPVESPFWGGLVGFVSYEAGLETIDVQPSKEQPARPDIWFVFVEKSVVIDHLEGVAYVQSLHCDDQSWLDVTKAVIASVRDRPAAPATKPPSCQPQAKIVSEPTKAEYCHKVLACQSHLRAGSSYELCLTDQTSIQSSEDPWILYQRLRAQNPAPFGACLALSSPTNPSQSIEVLSSSPERFLSWTRNGACQFRPIKGTVKKIPGVTREVAEAVLKSPKEQAENLMIVDLIRHDLSGVPGITNVHVPSLMAVEEYATLYQLVSVISGNFPQTTLGLPILAASLPPGSMTGAPKKRSCQLLSDIEGQHPRGLYSGVLGYLDVGGGGDFSVVIRTAFRYGGEGGVWRVGAGGAVTVLSEAWAEWEEMRAKREALLRVFGAEGGGA